MFNYYEKGNDERNFKRIKTSTKNGEINYKQFLGELNDEKNDRFKQLRKSLIRLT